MLGVKRVTVTQWERGENSPRTKQLKDLSQILGCTVAELLGLDENLLCDDSDCGHGEELISVTKEILFSHMRRLNEAADKTNNVDELCRISLAMQSITDAIVSLETEDI